MSKETLAEEAASTLQAMLRDAPREGSHLLSAAGLGIAGGAGAVYAIEHHGRVRARKATQHKG